MRSSAKPAAIAPPPDGSTTLVTCPWIVPTFTVTVIGGYEAPALNASERVQVLQALGQVHPVPAMEAMVNPVGRFSVTVTTPLVGPANKGLETVTAYVPVNPCVKVPVWVDCTVGTGATPSGVSTRIALLFSSAMYTLPKLSTATP